MNNELLLLIKNHTDILVQQTKTQPQQTFEFKMNTQMKTFSFDRQINLDEREWVVAVTSFETTNAVFKIADENNSFSIIKPSHWSTENAEETINKLKNLLDLRSGNDPNLHDKEVKKRANIIILDGKEYTYYILIDKFKYEFIEKVKKKNYDDLEDMVYRLELTKNEIIDIPGMKYTSTSTKGYTLPSGIYEIRDIEFMLQSLLPNDVEVKISFDDIRLESNLSTNQTIKFTKKSFFYTKLGFAQSHFYPLDDTERFYQIKLALYKRDKPINIIRIVKVHLKCDCVTGSILHGFRLPVLYNFSLAKPTGH